ncbi:hypothetical protein B7P43_G06222 [Cryptotermes secundus]|uniref:Uncharacterized protein n=1 Tax=Cryptotermes secundus TaxID=105785 RepID=A0A2J7RJR9_9NEOP|nr:uncharacterized protein LOC111875048 [Cryptotermes secundus]PNF41082.1 hypothetical protein B7P43_G06222 [Cryptotermes secundus]
MLFHWTLLAFLPCVVTSASVGELLLSRTSEKYVSPDEDSFPSASSSRSLIPSIERLQRREYQTNLDEDFVNDEPTYQYLEEDMGKGNLLSTLQAFTARRPNLKQDAFTVKPKGRPSLRLRRDTFSFEPKEPSENFRRHKAAFSLSAEESEMAAEPRVKRETLSPALDDVDENSTHWRRFDNPKHQFVTSRNQPTTGTRNYYLGVPQHRAGHTVDENDVRSAKYNEIPLQQRDPARYANAHVREPVAYRHEGEPPRRIIYYANLPEITRGRPVHDYRRDRLGYDDRYDYGRSYNKYPRESRYEGTHVRSPTGRDGPYPYRQTGNAGNSYSIIDAERPPPQNAWPPPQQYAYRDPDVVSRSNRIPAPYQQPQAGGRQAYDQRRGPPLPPPLPLPDDGPNAALHPSRYNQFGHTGSLPRHQLTVMPSNPAVGDEPYRDYNPRQPAPWSMQIGTKLTVKDDGRQLPSPGGKRFYVHSEEQYPSRFLRSDIDPDMHPTTF